MALPTREELLAAEFEDSDITSMIRARRKITEKSGQNLIKLAVEDAKNEQRRLKDQSQNIADAVDPTWPMVPDPRELQFDASYDEVRGHLTLLRFNYECDKGVLSRDRQSESHFLLFQDPFVYVNDSKYDENAEFRSFSIYKTEKLDNGPVMERIGVFITATEDWVGEFTEGEVEPCWHAWIGVVTRKKGKGFRLQIYDPNFHDTGRPTIKATKLRFMQKNFIMQARRA